jgi:hypothetical protein
MRVAILPAKASAFESPLLTSRSETRPQKPTAATSRRGPDLPILDLAVAKPLRRADSRAELEHLAVVPRVWTAGDGARFTSTRISPPLTLMARELLEVDRE